MYCGRGRFSLMLHFRWLRQGRRPAEFFKMTNGIQLIFRVFTCEKDRWAGILFFQKRWDSGDDAIAIWWSKQDAALSFVLPWIPRNKIEYCLSETIDCCTINQFHSKIVGIYFLSSFFFQFIFIFHHQLLSSALLQNRNRGLSSQELRLLLNLWLRQGNQGVHHLSGEQGALVSGCKYWPP